MTTSRFLLNVAPDAQGRTTVTLHEPDGTTRKPVALTLHGERALYALMGYVRPEVPALDVLDGWSVQSMSSVDIAPPSPDEIEKAIERCGF